MEESSSAVSNTFEYKMKSSLINSDVDKYTVVLSDGRRVPKTALVDSHLAILSSIFNAKVPVRLDEASKTFGRLIDQYNAKFKRETYMDPIQEKLKGKGVDIQKIKHSKEDKSEQSTIDLPQSPCAERAINKLNPRELTEEQAVEMALEESSKLASRYSKAELEDQALKIALEKSRIEQTAAYRSMLYSPPFAPYYSPACSHSVYSDMHRYSPYGYYSMLTSPTSNLPSYHLSMTARRRDFTLSSPPGHPPAAAGSAKDLDSTSSQAN